MCNIDIKQNNAKYLLFLTIFVSGLWISSCSNDFLDENYFPIQYSSADTLFFTNYSTSSQIAIDLKTTGNREWRIHQYPKWLNINPKKGVLSNGSMVELTFDINHQNFNQGLGYYIYPLVFEIEDAGLLTTTAVYANFGNPTIQINPTSITLENTLSGEFEILNRGDGILFWEITDQPNWLNVDITNGTLEQHFHVFVKYTADIRNLEPGDYNEYITINNNVNSSMRIPVSLKVNAQGYNGIYNDGELIDTKYLSETDQLVALTKNPNRLLFFRSDEDVPQILELDRVPKCLALLESANLIAIGYSNTEISTYQIQSRNLLQTYQTNAIPISLEFGSADYIYFIAKVDHSERLHSLNLINSEIVTSTKWESGLKPLLKIPNKNLLVSSKTGYSPDYLIFYDISQLGVTDSVNEYSMFVEGFWLSDDGERIFTGLKTIYKVPDYIPNKHWSVQELQKSGELELDNYYSIDCIAHHSASERIFVGNGQGSFSDKTIITQFHHTTLTKQKTYEITTLPPDDFPMSITWWERIVNMYPAKDGSKLWLVQKFPPAHYDDPDIWSVRKLMLE